MNVSKPSLRPFRRRLTAGACLVLLLGAACSSGNSSPTQPPTPDDGGGGTAAFTFTEIEGAIFSTTCATAGCHSAGSGQAGLVLAAGLAYDFIVGVPSTQRPGLSRIEPGDAEASYLVKKLRGDNDIVGERMPRGRAPLSRGDIDGIIAWVNAGAPRN